MSQINPNVSVDCVIFGFDFEKLNVLLIERNSALNGQPGAELTDFQLPGDLIRDDEDLDEAAQRVLKELTGLEDIFLEQFYAFGDPNRVKKEEDVRWLKSVRDQPDARVITVGYFSLVRLNDFHPQASSFAAHAEWRPVEQVPKLHFDHNEVFNRACKALHTKLRLEPMGLELLPPQFTLTQLQTLYEAISNNKLDKRNFRRKIQNTGILFSTGQKQTGVPHKPAELFEFNVEEYHKKRMEGGFSFN